MYLTNTLVKLDPGSKLEMDKEFGIKGFYLSGKLIKSRNNTAGINFKMVFEQKIGINNLLTNFINLKDLGRISGAGRSFKLDTCPDVKFSLKEFSNKYYSSPELKKAFDKAVEEEYYKLLNDEEDSPVINTSKEDNSNDAYDLLNKLIEETSNEVSFKDKLSIITVEEGTNVYRDNSTGKFYIENPDEETGFEEVEYTED